jgi:hypothetical protein
MKTSPNAKIVADRLRRRAVALLHSSPRNRSSEVWDSLRKNPKRGVERHSAIVPRMNCGSAREWMEIADSCRQRAALYRSAIERAERPGGRASGPHWAKVRGILLELAEDLEQEADDFDSAAEG